MEDRRNITYSLDDFNRYKQGLMSKEEMHALEKASMEDPFLADALEGFMQSDPALAETHRAEIAQHITGRQDKNTEAVIVPMSRSKFGWWRVAAMLIVVVGGGLLTYKLLDTKKTGGSTGGDPVASVQPTGTDSPGKAVPAAVMPQGNNTDSSKTTSSFDNNGSGLIAAVPAHRQGNNNRKKAQAIEMTGQKSLAFKDDAAKKENRNAGLDEVVVNKAPQRPAETSWTYANVYRPVSNEIRGVILTPSNEPLANANIRLDNSKKQAVTDKRGNFAFASRDSVVNATVSSEGYGNARVQLRSGMNNTVNLGTILMKHDSTLDVSVTGLGAAKKGRIADTTSAKPEGGWDSFQQYVAGKLKKQVDTTGRDMKITGGELQLEFYVDANGIPKDFKVLSSTDATLNEQAIEAVKKGPKWATRNKKTRILIRF